jgi:hypothetical protein
MPSHKEKKIMNRRDFIVSTVAAPAWFGVAGRLSSVSNRVNVTDFGADPRGITDSTASVRRAIAQLGRSGGTLVFPSGRYALSSSSSDEPSMVFSECNDIEINGDGSTLLLSGLAKPFAFTNCRNLHIHDFSIDYPRPPFSQGKVLAVGERWFEVKIDPEFPVVGGERVEAFADYDPKTSLMVQDGVDSYYNVTGTTLVEPQTLRVALKEAARISQGDYWWNSKDSQTPPAALKNPAAVREGSIVVLRHQVYGSDAFRLIGCSDVQFAHVKLFAAPGMGILAVRCRNVAVEDLQVDTPPHSTRLMSLCSDATHFHDCRGTVVLTNCHFRAMGDDAINSCTSYWKVVGRVDSRTIEVYPWNSEPFEASALPSRKDRILLLDGEDYQEVGELSVEEARLRGRYARLAFTESVPPELAPGTLAYNRSNSTKTSVRNCEFLGNRARAILVHENAEIVENTISNCSLAAILMTSDPDWMEGPPVRNIRIERNRFSNCYYAWPASRRGAITLDIYEDKRLQRAPKARIHHDVQIINNDFADTGGAAVYCAAASKLNIANNRIARTWIGNQQAGEPDAIILVNVADSEVSKNISSIPQAIMLQSCEPTIKVTGNTRLTNEEA